MQKIESLLSIYMKPEYSNNNKATMFVVKIYNPTTEGAK